MSQILIGDVREKLDTNGVQPLTRVGTV